MEQEIGGTKPTEKGTESPEIRAHEEGSSGQADELGSTSEVDHERMKAQGTKLKTKNVIEIMKVVGDCSEVRQFDDLRCRLKSAKQVAPADKNRYQHIFYKLQLMVQRNRTSLIEQIAAIERRFHKAHGRLPSEKDCSEIGTLMEKCKHINKLLLQVWKSYV